MPRWERERRVRWKYQPRRPRPASWPCGMIRLPIGTAARGVVWGWEPANIPRAGGVGPRGMLGACPQEHHPPLGRGPGTANHAATGTGGKG